MTVVNDVAERGVHLAQMFNNKITMDPDERQDIFLVVDHY